VALLGFSALSCGATAEPRPVIVHIEPSQSDDAAPTKSGDDHATAPELDCAAAMVELYRDGERLVLRHANPFLQRGATTPYAELIHRQNGSVGLHLSAIEEASGGWNYFDMYVSDVDETRMERRYESGDFSFTPDGGSREHDEFQVEGVTVTIERFDDVGGVVIGRFGPAVNEPDGAGRRARTPATFNGTFVMCRTADHVVTK